MASCWTRFKTITSHCSVPFWVEPCEGAKVISERKCMFAQQLQASCRLLAGCKGRGAGAHLAEEPHIWCTQSCTQHYYYEWLSALWLPRLREARCARGQLRETCKALPWFPAKRHDGLCLVLKSFWPLSASSTWHLCSNCNGGMHLLSITLVVESHSLSSIGFMIDLFNFFLF